MQLKETVNNNNNKNDNKIKFNNLIRFIIKVRIL